MFATKNHRLVRRVPPLTPLVSDETIYFKLIWNLSDMSSGVWGSLRVLLCDQGPTRNRTSSDSSVVQSRTWTSVLPSSVSMEEDGCKGNAPPARWATSFCLVVLLNSLCSLSKKSPQTLSKVSDKSSKQLPLYNITFDLYTNESKIGA